MKIGDPIARGNTATIYLSDNKIVKVFNEYLPDTESYKEAAKQKYANVCGLPVPEIYDVTRINGKQAIIMEYVKGETLGDLMLKNKERTERYVKLSVDIQLNIHRIMTDEIESMHDKLYRQINSVNELELRQQNQLLKKLETMTYENRLCHGDFHLFNLIQTEDQVFVIDWVDATAGDIRADVYRTYLLYSQVSSEIADMYIRLYCEKSGLATSEIFEWAPMIAAARLSENVSSENSERLIEIINTYDWGTH